ncbi:MAG: HlyD family type I secretion periplasmic adaptor subunit [Silicimonas sp.]|nr:HlyD family type I secretion periplasmic adaptor subunit [Silicimonas sp.]
MTRKTRSDAALRQANLKKHGGLSAGIDLPEAHDTRHARRLIYTLMATLLAAILWAGNTPVNEITSGSGVIATRTLAERVEHPDGGLVAEIHVAKGQRVEAGAPLMRFDTGALERELGKLQASRIALQAERSRIDFLLQDRGAVPEFDSLDELDPSELLFWAEQSYLTAQLDLIASESQAIEAGLTVLQARHGNLGAEAELLTARLERSRKGQTSGALARNEVERVEREALQLDRARLELAGDITAQKGALETKGLERAELLAKRAREAALRRAEIDEKLTSATLSIEEIEARIARARVTATVDGTIMELAVANPREVVAPGDLIVEIVPDHSAIEAAIEIPADRIGHVDIGMEARLKVLSYDFTRFGEITGHVASVSPSSFETETGETMYRVTIALPGEGRDVALVGRPVRPGMTVTADILTDSKKVLSYLLKPLRVLSDKALTEA